MGAPEQKVGGSSLATFAAKGAGVENLLSRDGDFHAQSTLMRNCHSEIVLRQCVCAKSGMMLNDRRRPAKKNRAYERFCVLSMPRELVRLASKASFSRPRLEERTLNRHG